MSFASLSAQLKLDISDFSKKLTNAASRMAKFSETLSSGYKDANVALRSHTLGLKDTARIVQGIMISQTFYAAANAIQGATTALMQFNEQLDYAQVTYSALFGDVQLASDFIKVLQQHSINTIFEFQDLSEMSKKLMAYGIEYENLMYIMEGMTNLGAMSGDTAALDRIALALGQIQTTGYLAATEMRQLANAYVPIYDIVQSAFGLTGEQMQSVGDLKLPAHEVINAIVEYANARFGSVGDAAMMTITGLKNRIVDTVKVLGSEMTAPLTAAWKSFLAYVSDGLVLIRQLYTQGGTGAIFEHFVPSKEAQKLIRSFFATLHDLFMTVATTLHAIGPALSIFAQSFMIAFNAVGSVVIPVINYLAALVRVITENTAAASLLRGALASAAVAFVVFKTASLGALVVSALTKAITKLAVALRVLAMMIVKHPILMLLGALAVTLVGVAGASSKAREALSSFFNSITNFGVSGGDIFKNTSDSADDLRDSLDQFNNPLEGSKDAAEELGDALGGAGKDAKKAAAGLLSFDEVFKLNDSSKDAAGGGIGADISNMLAELDKIGAGIGGALIPEVPDFSSFIDEFTGNLYGGLAEKMMTIASGGATGMLIGGLAGFAIGALVTKSMKGALAGAKLGTKIGAIAGSAFAAIFGDAYKSMEEALQGVAVGGTAGLIIGALAGMFIGAFATKSLAGAMAGARLGSTIGSLVGGTFGGIFGAASDELRKQIEQLAFGTAHGALLGGLAGMIIGAFATKTLAGAMTGAKWGASIGSMIGGPIETIFGDAEKTIGERLSNLFGDISAAGYGSLIGGLSGMIIGAVVGALAGGIGAIPGAKVGASIGASLGSLGGMLVSYLNNAGITEAVGQWFSSLGEKISGWFAGAWDSITTWFSNTKRDFNNWSEVTLNITSDWAINTGAEIGQWCATTWQDIESWTVDAGKSIGNWCTTAWHNIRDWTINTGRNISDWCYNTWSSIKNWTINAAKSVGDWCSDTWSGIKSWTINTAADIGNWASETWGTFSSWCVDTADDLSTWWTSTKDGFRDFAGNVKSKITEGFSKAAEKISEFLGLETSIGTFCSNALKSIKNFASGIWDSISDKFGKAIDKIKEYIRFVKEAAQAAGEKLANTGVGKVVSGAVDFVGNLFGHASGGIFDREHIARFAEGNRAEAIIPLENARAMQPFVDAVSNGILGHIAPVLAQSGGGYGNANQLQPLYVGTLIADERGLKELYKRFEVIQIQEDARRGTTR